jgi:hypothetical protein
MDTQIKNLIEENITDKRRALAIRRINKMLSSLWILSDTAFIMKLLIKNSKEIMFLDYQTHKREIEIERKNKYLNAVRGLR